MIRILFGFGWRVRHHFFKFQQRGFVGTASDLRVRVAPEDPYHLELNKKLVMRFIYNFEWVIKILKTEKYL